MCVSQSGIWSPTFYRPRSLGWRPRDRIEVFRETGKDEGEEERKKRRILKLGLHMSESRYRQRSEKRVLEVLDNNVTKAVVGHIGLDSTLHN